MTSRVRRKDGCVLGFLQMTLDVWEPIQEDNEIRQKRVCGQVYFVANAVNRLMYSRNYTMSD